MQLFDKLSVLKRAVIAIPIILLLVIGSSVAVASHYKQSKSMHASTLQTGQATKTAPQPSQASSSSPKMTVSNKTGTAPQSYATTATPAQPNTSQELAQKEARECQSEVDSDNLAIVNLNNQTLTEYEGLEYQHDSVTTINAFIDQQNAGVRNLYNEDQSSMNSICPGYQLTLPTPWLHITSY